MQGLKHCYYLDKWYRCAGSERWSSSDTLILARAQRAPSSNYLLIKVTRIGTSIALNTHVMTAEELLQRYAAGERDFSGSDLSGVNLSGADLLHINLSGVNLSGADLVETRLYGADMRQCNLSGADLRNADLRVSRLDEVNFQDANLQGANWRNAERFGAFFSNTTMPDGEIVAEPNWYE